MPATISASMSEEQIHRDIFERAYHAFAVELFRFVVYKVSDAEKAEDIVADTFLTFWKRVESGEVAYERSLLYVIARGRIIDHYRQVGRRGATFSLESIPSEPLEDSDVQDNLDVVLNHERVIKALEELNESYAEIIYLHYVEDVPIADISRMSNSTDNATRVRLHRAINELRKKLI
ncbi:MAG: hypothetical protein RLZZ480_919 [Candidatus Parcubacteria bacterium]|jgi:RNA polymerase sigma-70 factor (ECF subfamily)